VVVADTIIGKETIFGLGQQKLVKNNQDKQIQNVTLGKQSLCSGHSRYMALLSRPNREVFIDQYNFIYTYVASSNIHSVHPNKSA